MHIIDAEAVHERLAYPGLIEALARAHRDSPPWAERTLMQAPDHGVHRGEAFLVLPAWFPGRAMGVKMATVIPRNAEAGRPTIHANYQLFDGDTGEPKANIDGTALTLRKTAADSALGSRLLARTDATTLLMVGAGALAPHLIAAHQAARPSLRRVLVWNRTTRHRDSLVEALRAEEIDAEAVDSIAAAIPEADIICCATGTMEPLIHGELLRPGQHLDLVGSFNPSMRESDNECVRRARLFVDFRASTVDAAGDLFHPITDGIIDEEDILADLFELCSGHNNGRRDETEITLFKNGGGAHLDLFTAEYLVEQVDRG
ncbi:MAG: ornithine cyclodeaminase family protein [Halofilum sp. (in: g-proteobacteria)]